MAEEERKAKAVITAAVKFIKEAPVPTAIADNPKLFPEFLALFDAVSELEKVKSAEPPADPMAFICPHCKAPKPSYGWHYNFGDTGAFAVAYLTCFCGECKNILSVATTTFVPAKQLADELMRQFQKKTGAGGPGGRDGGILV